MYDVCGAVVVQSIETYIEKYDEFARAKRVGAKRRLSTGIPAAIHRRSIDPLIDSPFPESMHDACLALTTPWYLLEYPPFPHINAQGGVF